MEKITVKKFDELTVNELYEILSARSAIFVVEQNCVYHDPDGNDKGSYHLFISDDDGRIKAYLRVCPQGVIRKDVTIGRVITVQRGAGLGAILVKYAVEFAKRELDCDRIAISSQVQAKGFYEKCGFNATGEVYDEDGIPHVMMYRSV